MRKIVMIDADETLIYSRRERPNSIYFDYCLTKNDSTCGRPSAKPFLVALKAKGYDIYLMTQGHIDWQRACLEELDLDHFFIDMFGYASNDSKTWTPSPELLKEKWVLVDNLSHDDRTLWDKCRWLDPKGLGVHLEPGKNFLKCEPFYGLEDEIPLTDLLPKIYSILD